MKLLEMNVQCYFLSTFLSRPMLRVDHHNWVQACKSINVSGCPNTCWHQKSCFHLLVWQNFYVCAHWMLNETNSNPLKRLWSVVLNGLPFDEQVPSRIVKNRRSNKRGFAHALLHHQHILYSVDRRTWTEKNTEKNFSERIMCFQLEIRFFPKFHKWGR